MTKVHCQNNYFLAKKVRILDFWKSAKKSHFTKWKPVLKYYLLRNLLIFISKVLKILSLSKKCQKIEKKHQKNVKKIEEKKYWKKSGFTNKIHQNFLKNVINEKNINNVKKI